MIPSRSSGVPATCGETAPIGVNESKSADRAVVGHSNDCMPGSEKHFQISFTPPGNAALEDCKRKIRINYGRMKHFASLARQFEDVKKKGVCDIIDFAAKIRTSAQIKGKLESTRLFVTLFIWDSKYDAFREEIKNKVLPKDRIQTAKHCVFIKSWIDFEDLTELVGSYAYGQRGISSKILEKPLMWYKRLQREKFKEMLKKVGGVTIKDFKENPSKCFTAKQQKTLTEIYKEGKAALISTGIESIMYNQCMAQFKKNYPEIEHIREAQPEIQEMFISQCADLVYGTGNWEIKRVPDCSKEEMWQQLYQHRIDIKAPEVAESSMAVHKVKRGGLDCFYIGTHRTGFAYYEKKKYGFTMVRILYKTPDQFNPLSLNFAV
jgi:hypothetical protein